MNVKNIFNKKIINKKRLITVIVVALLLVVMILSNPDVWNYLFGREPIKIAFQSGVEYKALPYGDEILLVNGEGIRAVNDRGEDEWNIVFSMNSPMTVVKDDYILVADMGGRVVNLYDEEKMVYQVKPSEDILTAKVNEEGYVAVATDELGYKGAVSVFDDEGKACFKWHSGSGYIADIDLSSENMLAVAQIMTDREKVYTRIMYLNTENKDDVRSVGEVEGLVMKLRFNDDDELVVVSDHAVSCYDDDGQRTFNVGFGGRIPVGCNIENDDNLVFAFDGGLNNTVFESYSEDGEKRGQYNVGSQIRNFDVSGENIIYSTPGKVYHISPEGKLVEEIATSVESRDLKIFPDNDRFMVVGGSSAEILRLD